MQITLIGLKGQTPIFQAISNGDIVGGGLGFHIHSLKGFTSEKVYSFIVQENWLKLMFYDRFSSLSLFE